MLSETINKKYKEFITSTGGNTKSVLSKFQELLGGQSDIVINSNLSSNNNIILNLHQQREPKILLYELTRQTINKEYNLDNYINLLDSLYKDFSQFMNATMVEVIWLIGFTFEKRGEQVNEGDQDNAKILASILSNLVKKKYVSNNVLIEKLEENTLFDCGLITDKKSFKTKFTRVNTKITYEQQKYNLLREESEGFAKLIFLLFEVKINLDNVGEYIDKILCLIGFFDLDPNRVLDIILSAFEKDCYNLGYLEIIRLFNPNALPQILGFKLRQKEGIEENNSGIYIITAQLIKHNLLELLKILPHLSPGLADCEKAFKARLEFIGEFYKTIPQRVGKELSLMSAPISASNDSMTKTANYFANFGEIFNEIYKSKESKNQIYKVFEGLVKVRAEFHCEVVYSLLEEFYDPLVCPSLTETLCETLNWMIEPLYEKYSKKSLFKSKMRKNSSPNTITKEANEINSFNRVYTAEKFIHEIPKVLKYLTLGLSQDQVLFTKILIIIRNNSKIFFNTEREGNSGNSNSASSHEFQKIITDLICKVFLPSLSLIDPTPALVNELWTVLSNFDYSKRYKIYNYWINNIYTSHPALYIKYSVVLKEADKWQKTLSKENQRAHGRTLGVITNANPIVVFDNIIRVMTSYDNYINVFMQTLSFCSSLSYDVITYIISKILADPNKEKLNEENGDIAGWFKNFANFIGHFFKKFHFAEFSGIVYFLVNKLKTSASFIDMYVLKEMIEKMSGIIIQEDLNESQIHACAGGLHLYLESMELVKEHKNYKKPIQSLLKFFTLNAETSTKENSEFYDINGEKNDTSLNKNQLSFTSVLLLLLGIRRQNIIYNSNYTQSKLIGYLYDQLQNVYLQLMQFLSMYTDREAFSKFLPKWNLYKYTLNYNTPPEVVFFMTRNKLKPLYEMSSSEYEDCINQFQTTLDTYHSGNKKIFSEGYDSMYIEKENLLEDIYKDIWKFLTPELYFIFSSLQLRDIYVPVSIYEREIEKNKKEYEKLIEESKGYSESKNKKELEKLRVNMENLEKEMSSLKSNNEKIVKFLDEKKTSLLDDNSIPKANRREISRYLIQFCLYPRLIFSKVEAVYAAKMLVLLINLKIQNVNVFDVMQKMIKFLLPCVLCLTEFEAQNLGVFLLEFLKVVKYWHEDSVWESECFSNPAFSRSLDTVNPVDLPSFKNVIICLLSKMNSTFLTIFSGEDYMSCRNAIIVLNSLTSVYPPVKEIANELTSSIDKALEKFSQYKDLTTRMKRYRDILLAKKDSLPYESEITGEIKEKGEYKEKEKEIKSNYKDNKEEREKEKSNSKGRNGEKKKKKERSKERDRDKKRDESARTPDMKRRDEDYKVKRK